MDTANYRSLLQTELEEITKELQEVGIQNSHNAEDWIAKPASSEEEADENVRADKAEDLEERTALVADLETRFNLANNALLKIEDGTYGVCEVDGGQIEEERLMANPSARTCIAHREEELPV